MVEHNAPGRPRPSYADGFVNLDEEVAVDWLPVQGQLPDWLAGTLLRVSPARYDLGHQTVSHWFDGLAMLHRFGFADGTVSYANRFPRSQVFESAEKHRRLTIGGFATDPCTSLFQRVRTLFKPGRPDNCNVSINALAHDVVALTETRLPIRFDPETLETLGAFEIDRELEGIVSTAHPHHDAERGCQFSYLIDFGRTSRYRLFAIDDADGRQRVIRACRSRR